MIIKNHLAVLMLAAALAACGPQPSPDVSRARDTSVNELRTTDPLPTGSIVRLSNHVGDTFYQVLMEQDGIVDRMTRDQKAPFEIAQQTEVLTTLNRHYTPKVVSKTGSQTRLADTVRRLRDAQGTRGFSTEELKAQGIGRAAVEIIGLASGAGVRVEIDADNYFYNISYERGERQPGRSYGVGPARKADDTSYPDYFRRMTDYLSRNDGEEVEEFYRATMNVLAASEPSRIDALNKYGENLATDFFLIYVAEAYRKLTGGSGGSFHKDLLETSLLAPWSLATGKVVSKYDQPFAIVDGDLDAFVNASENGSGLGFHSHRWRLQKLVCEAVRAQEPAILADLEAVVGSTRRRDCIQKTAYFLNDPSSQAALKAKAAQLTVAVVAFVKYTREHADEILRAID